MRHRLFLAGLTLTVIFTGCSAPKPLAPVSSQTTANRECPLTPHQMEQALITGAHQAHWQLSKHGKGHFSAIRRDGKNNAKIAISHTGQRYYVTYLDSHGLDYDGQRITMTYHQWLEELAAALKTNIAIECVRSEPVPRVPQSLLTPEVHAPTNEVIETPVMIESVPMEMLRVN